MPNYSELEEGQTIVFRHKIGEAGNISENEKVGVIERLDGAEQDFPVKVRIGLPETGQGEDNRVATFIDGEEVNRIVK